MGSVTEEGGVLLCRVLSSSSSSSASSDEWNPTDTVIFFGLSLGLGIACSAGMSCVAPESLAPLLYSSSALLLDP